MWHDVDGMGWWMIWGGLMMLLFWGGLILLGYWLAQTLSRPHSPEDSGGQDNRALSIAGERYARGDITREEFERIKTDVKAP